MYRSELSHWNTFEMIRIATCWELRDATRAHGRICRSNHRAEHWFSSPGITELRLDIKAVAEGRFLLAGHAPNRTGDPQHSTPDARHLGLAAARARSSTDYRPELRHFVGGCNPDRSDPLHEEAPRLLLQSWRRWAERLDHYKYDGLMGRGHRRRVERGGFCRCHAVRLAGRCRP